MERQWECSKEACQGLANVLRNNSAVGKAGGSTMTFIYDGVLDRLVAVEMIRKWLDSGCSLKLVATGRASGWDCRT